MIPAWKSQQFAGVRCRKQFPALPTMTPVIPSWQLQGSTADEDNTASRAETESSTTALDSAENRTDIELSVTAAVETNGQSSGSLQDDATQPSPVQVYTALLL